MVSKPAGLKIMMMIALVATFLAGCGTVTPTAAPTSVPPTVAPTINLAPTLSQVQTQAVQTFAANLTSAAPPPPHPATPVPPTLTPPPSATATPANPPTALPMATKTSIPYHTPTLSTYNCVVFKVSPAPSDTIKANIDFTGTWSVENTGTENWPGTEVYIRYLYGEKFQTDGDVIGLGRSVGPLGTYTVNIPMHSPDLAGPYYARWEIQFGSLNICTLNMTLHVVN